MFGNKTIVISNRLTHFGSFFFVCFEFIVRYNISLQENNSKPLFYCMLLIFINFKYNQARFCTRSPLMVYSADIYLAGLAVCIYI